MTGTDALAIPQTADFVVVGGGIIGLAVARQLLIDVPSRSVLVLEKEYAIATHQTGHNSGVAHAGIYYRPGSQKAELTRRALGALRQYTQAHDIPYVECGKLVIASSVDEEGRLRELFERATANGVPGLEMVGPAGIVEHEPAAVGEMAIWSPTTAITDFVAIAGQIATDVVAAGGRIVTGIEVVDLKASSSAVEVSAGSSGQTIAAGTVIVCAGVHSDRLAVMAGDSPDPAVVPFRGEYLSLTPEKADLIRGLIYPVPDPRYPFLGVHFTRTVDGRVLVGPNAVLALARDGYQWRDIDAGHLRRLAGTAGFWRLAAKHWPRGAAESWRSLNKRSYARDVSRYVPGITSSDLVPAHSGVRA